MGIGQAKTAFALLLTVSAASCGTKAEVTSATTDGSTVSVGGANAAIGLPTASTITPGVIELASSAAVEPAISSAPSTQGAVTTSPPASAAAISEWTVEGSLRVTFVTPASFIPDPKLKPLADVDRAAGLYLLKRWVVDGNPNIAAISVQRDPGDNAPINKASKPYATIANSTVTWNLVDFGGMAPGRENIVGLARYKGYLVEITGTDQLVRTVVAALTLSGIG